MAHGNSADLIEKGIHKLGTRTCEIGVPLEPDTNLGVLAMNLAAALHVATESLTASKGDDERLT
jgi:hypothetical protein